MLQIVEKITTDPAVHPRPGCDHHSPITMFEARRQPLDVRTDMAAMYMRDPAVVKPSAVLARYIFRVGIPRIKAAQSRLDIAFVEPELERAWNHATPAARADFVRNHAMQMLREIDRLTHP